MPDLAPVQLAVYRAAARQGLPLTDEQADALTDALLAYAHDVAEQMHEERLGRLLEETDHRQAEAQKAAREAAERDVQVWRERAQAEEARAKELRSQLARLHTEGQTQNQRQRVVSLSAHKQAWVAISCLVRDLMSHSEQLGGGFLVSGEYGVGCDHVYELDRSVQERLEAVQVELERHKKAFAAAAAKAERTRAAQLAREEKASAAAATGPGDASLDTAASIDS